MNQQLSEIKETLSKATPGPWTHSRWAYGYVVTDYPLHNTIASVVEYNEDGTVHGNFDNWENNRQLIANAPQWLASLISEVERLQTIEEHAIKRIKTETKANSEYAKQVEEMQKTINHAIEESKWGDPENALEKVVSILQSLKGAKP